MSYEQYWDEDPHMIVHFARYYSQKIHDDFAEQDMLAWMIGSYVDCAVSDCLGAMFGKKGVANQSKYPSSPVFIKELDEDTKTRKQENKVLKDYANFIAMVASAGQDVSEAAQF